MAATLIGQVVNTCDSITGFNAGNISSDDENAQGTGSIGTKVSNSVQEFYTTALTGGPYNFSSGGAHFGYHIIMWFSSKSKLDAASGYRIVVGSGTNRAQWDVPPVTSELKRNGAFVSRVVDTARSFDRVVSGTSWNILPFSNPAQLSNVDTLGGALQTTVSIMGNFNNVQIDQMTIGMGIRLSGGTVGTPDTFETARAADEDSGIWGWSQATVLKGGIYIGPATGSAASVFTSVNERRVFSAGYVGAGFYRIEGRGAGTDVTLTNCSIRADNPAVARWDYTVGSTTKTWNDTGSTYAGIRNMTLSSVAVLSGVSISDTTNIVHNGATLTNLNVRGSKITTATPNLITSSVFQFVSGTGHAIEITTPGTYTFSANSFTGYGAGGTTTAAIYNNSGGLVTLNITNGGSTPTVRNGTGASTNIVNTKVFTVTNIIEGTEVRIFRTSDSVELAGAEIVGASPSGLSNVTVSTDPDNPGRFRMEYSYGYTSDTNVFIMAVHNSYLILRQNAVLRSTDGSLLISQIADRQYSNPV
jgi:hypothetical protein